MLGAGAMSSSIPILLERDNVNDETVTLVRWFVKDGEKVDADALLAEVETSKANIEVHSPGLGYLTQNYPAGSEIPVSGTIGVISDQPATKNDAARAPENSRSVAAPISAEASSAALPLPQSLARASSSLVDLRRTSQYRQRISPLAERMMAEHGIPASVFAGKSLVRKKDILDYLNPAPPIRPQEAVGVQRGAAKITQAYREVSLSKRKRSEAANLGAGMGNAVASSVSVVCFTRGLRRILEAKLGDGNASAVFVYEVSRLLRKYPVFNAVYRDGMMLQYEHVNIGFAVDDGRGLKVPVLLDCDEKELQEIAGTLHEMTIAYTEDRLTPAQIANPTFTISDMSGLGVSDFLPLISDNQAAILGIGGEQFAPGSGSGFFTLTLTFDHQLSDGRTAALFLNDLKFRLLCYDRMDEPMYSDFICSHCSRSLSELRSVNEHLLQSAEPGSYLCTICVPGWK